MPQHNVLTVYLYTIVPKGLFPQQDTGRLGRAGPWPRQDIAFDAMREKQRTLRR